MKLSIDEAMNRSSVMETKRCIDESVYCQVSESVKRFIDKSLDGFSDLSGIAAARDELAARVLTTKLFIDSEIYRQKDISTPR